VEVGSLVTGETSPEQQIDAAIDLLLACVAEDYATGDRIVAGLASARPSRRT
jgi:hypothetical protein